VEVIAVPTLDTCPVQRVCYVYKFREKYGKG